jgi:hypothetical protein
MNGFEWAFDPTSKRRTIHLVPAKLSGKPPRYWTLCMVTSFAPEHPLNPVSNTLKPKPGAYCSKCMALEKKESAETTSLSQILNDPDSNRASWSASQAMDANVPAPPTPESTQVTLREGTSLNRDIIGGLTWIVIAICIGVLGAFALYHFTH